MIILSKFEANGPVASAKRRAARNAFGIAKVEHIKHDCCNGNAPQAVDQMIAAKPTVGDVGKRPRGARPRGG